MPRHLFHHFAIAGLLASAASVHAEAPDRFDGGATLSAAQARSDDGRFQLHAELRQATASVGGRFGLDARLVPEARSIAAVCTPAGVTVFSNGFE